jgi:hypothetical protein
MNERTKKTWKREKFQFLENEVEPVVEFWNGNETERIAIENWKREKLRRRENNPFLTSTLQEPNSQENYTGNLRLNKGQLDDYFPNARVYRLREEEEICSSDSDEDDCNERPWRWLNR